MVELAESALRAESGRVLVDLAESAPNAEPGYEQGDRSSATSSVTSSECSDPVDREELQAESLAVTHAPEAADRAEPVARDFNDLIANFQAQSQGILARTLASAVKAGSAADHAVASAASAGLAEANAELAQRKAELAALEAISPSAKRSLDLAEDHPSEGLQLSEASRPSRRTRSRVQRDIAA